ncbi:MAG TPA: ATP-binding protein [Patescibacteria group bacterium]|nr:ATP-binding protein [Patescibacteria group bacterium]
MTLNTQKVNEFVIKVLTAASVNETYKIIVETATQLFETPYCSIHIKVDDGFKRVYSTLPDEYQYSNRKQGYIYQAFKSKMPFMKSYREVIFYHPEIKNSKIKHIIYLPLSYKNDAIGTLTINTLKDKKLLKKDYDILLLFGALSSLAIRRAQSEEEMKGAVRLRDEFISLAAHELRTPLTAIYGYAQLLHKRFAHVNSQELGWINELYSQTFRLTYIVNELLEVTRISSSRQKFLLQKCNLPLIVENVVKRYRIMDPKRKYILNIKLQEGEGIMIGDNEKINQLVAHLIDNADKFSLDDTEIEVALVLSKNNIELHVINTGDKMTNKDFSRFFERFYKGENNEGRGIGLGLYLAENIVINHKGKIALKDIGNNKIDVVVSFPKFSTFSKVITP